MGRLFGTDGARGVANTELTCETAMAIGRAAAMVLAETHKRPRVLIGKDTRMSSDMLEAALAAGLCSVGADVTLLGVVPTPAVAYLVGAYGADAAVMISASHNPCEYNGIKLFSGKGYKLPDAVEEEIEAIVLDNAEDLPVPVGGAVGSVTRCDTAVDDYVAHLVSCVEGKLDGFCLAIDCANGSASTTARKLFTALGADCVFLCDTPDGVNINDGCGSTHVDKLGAFVRENGLDGGVAFDGDADRCLAVDAQGNVLDGDQIIALLATHMMHKGELNSNTAVVTVMSNLGFFRYCENAGITTAVTKVGDRYVLEEMLAGEYRIGGEQSGHIIMTKYATTGDGQLSAIKLIETLKAMNMTFEQAGRLMERYPQVMVNVTAGASQKAAFAGDKVLQKVIARADESLGRDGRVLVRVSGTEPLVRVMVEGRSEEEIRRVANELAERIRIAIGGR